MALLRNIAGFGQVGMVVDTDTMLCNDNGCSSTLGDGGGGGVVYQVSPGLGGETWSQPPPVQIQAAAADDLGGTSQQTAPVNVAVVTPEPATQKKDSTGLMILAGLGVLLALGKGKAGYTYPALYLGGVGALYIHLKNSK